MSPKTPILLVESDRQFASALARELSADGYRVEIAHHPEQALERTSRDRPRLMLVGRLPGSQLQMLLERTRASGALPDGRHRPPAILVLGAEAGGLEALRAFEAGADDFMPRPLSYLELRARLRALLRRTPLDGGSDVLEVGELRIDLRTRRATAEGHGLELTRIEFELLVHLARMPDQVFTREQLLGSVWGFRSPGASRTIDTHASRLRAKLDRACARSGRLWIVAVRGVGYRLI